MQINWWNLDDREIIHLRSEYLDKLKLEIESRHGSLITLGKKLAIGTLLYNSLKYKSQGISVLILRSILSELKIDYKDFSDAVYGIGRNRSLMETKFPIELNPYFGGLLAHAFFDGYADKKCMRYSNYNIDHRKEFVMLANKSFIGKLKINNPSNYERDIDLPAIVPRLLVKFFNIRSFYSKKCRISEEFLEQVKKDKELGHYFLKGAFIDEGSITGGQIWIVRGIVNKKLANDIKKLCKILKLNTRIKLTSKKYGGYSVGVFSDSFKDFSQIVITKSWNKYKKLNKLNDMMYKRNLLKNRDLKGRYTKNDLVMN